MPHNRKHKPNHVSPSGVPTGAPTGALAATLPVAVLAAVFSVMLAVMLVLAPLGAGGVARAQTTEFLSILPEIPLPPGFVERDGESVIFDKPGGRIASATAAAGNAAGARALAFYTDTLPALGWSAFEPAGAEGGAWGRDGEVLRIEVRAAGGGAVLSYSLKPGP